MIQVNGHLVIGYLGYRGVECLLTVAKRYDCTYLNVLIVKDTVTQEYAFVQFQYILFTVFSVGLVGRYFKLKGFTYT